MAGADGREAKKRTQEFRTKYRYEQSAESKALAEAKCAVIEVRLLDAALVLFPAAIVPLCAPSLRRISSVGHAQVLEIILQFKTNSLLTVRVHASTPSRHVAQCLRPDYSVPLSLSSLLICTMCSVCSRSQTFITKFKHCVQMEQVSRTKRSVRVPLLHTAMVASFDPYDTRACAFPTAHSAHSTSSRSLFTVQPSVFGVHCSLFTCRKGLDLQQRMAREIKRTTEQALGLPMDKLKEILIVCIYTYFRLMLA